MGEGIACLGLVTFRVVGIRLAKELSPTEEQLLAVIVLPLFSALAIRVAVFLNRWAPWIAQASKFCLIGLFNTTIDFAVLNVLIAYLGVTHGVLFSLCKAISFGMAVLNSYGWNRLWTFGQAAETKSTSARVNGHPFSRFLGVTLIGAGLNVGTATVIVSILDLSGPFAPVRLANLAAVLALVVSATWDFFAYRHIVFAHAISGRVLERQYGFRQHP